MNIGIIGAGHVGGTLGRRFAAGNRHIVTFGIRHTADEELRDFIDTSGGAARAASPAEAAGTAEAIVLATPWKETRSVVEGLGDLRGKIIIDATNPFRSGLTGLDVPPDSSAAQQIALWVPGARVVKAFNTTGFNIMANPVFPEGPAAMFYCGDDAAAKSTVRDLIAEIGFDPYDAGPLERARALEGMALVWVTLAMGGDIGRGIAFRLARRQAPA